MVLNWTPDPLRARADLLRAGGGRRDGAYQPDGGRIGAAHRRVRPAGEHVSPYYRRGTPAAATIRYVTVDGVPVPDWQIADTDEGFVIREMGEPQPSGVSADGLCSSVELQTLRGQVEVRS